MTGNGNLMAGRPKKLLMVISTLEGGGAERVVTYLLRFLDRRRVAPVLVLLQEKIDYAPDLPADVRVVCLSRGSIRNLPRLLLGLVRVMRKERPDLVVSFLTFANLLTILAHRLAGVEAGLLVSERNHVSRSLDHVRLGGVKKLLVRLLYRRPHRILGVSRGVCRDLTGNFGVEAARCLAIPNPCDLERIAHRSRQPADHPWFQEDLPVFVAVGRLTRQKNYPLLLKAAALARADAPLRLMILGAGELRRELEALAGSLGIADAVAFLGFRENPFAYLARARGLVLSSSWEGFPNVLLEAMALSAPVIATRCPSGPEEIITHGVNGLLAPVDDPPALAAALTLLGTDADLAGRLGKAGRLRVEDFQVGLMVREYETVFGEAWRGAAGEPAPLQSPGEVRP